MNNCDLRLGDCLEVMATLADNSVDLTVTSPPYDNLRTYNGFTFDFEGIARELYRVTKPGGVVVWVVGDATVKGSETGTSFRQALYFRDVCGFNLHDTMIWAKPNPVPTQSTRYQAAFEYMFVLSKGAPKATHLLREPSIKAGQKRGNKHRARVGGHADNAEGVYFYAHDKIRSNYWQIPGGNGDRRYKHPAAFPETIARDHILSWSNEGDTVLDPFLGSGTTGKMARQHGRKFVGIEISADYLAIATRRIAEAVPSDLFAAA
jgi:site-specific DNA-methyltransferase (adenine-specific)